MKKSEDTLPNDLENVEDLTLFANESFDTDDVDLFEFTGDSDSPLTRLKSIILSLDWEISDDILQELIDEIDNLQQIWQGDKVAQVYLQGLHKIGNYLRAEGAYSHPNAIKLLLSFFYNFEKIISSETITGDAITSMLKADVRKFKILQYQINQKSSISNIATEESATGELAITGEDTVEAIPECEPLTCLKATILGLEWEVTDKGLDQFNTQIADIREHFMDNKSAQILIQGLQALGGYITDERADAHPEAFSMLHSFYEGLELLLDEKNIDEEEKQNVLIDRVNRLNALKAIIAETRKDDKEASSEDIIDEVLSPMVTEDKEKVEEESGQSQDADFSQEPVEALADVEAPEESILDDMLDPSAITPVDDKIADDFIEQELLVGGAIAGAAALSGAEDEIESLEEPVEGEFEEELDLFFTDEEENIFEPSSDEEDSDTDEGFEDLELAFTEEEFDLDFSDEVAELTDEAASEKEVEIDEDFEQLFTEEDETGLQPALADAEEEGGFDETEIAAALPEVPSDEIEDKLDAFFGLDEEPEDAEEVEHTPLQEEMSVAPALADAEEEGGFNEDETAATLAEEPSAEIEDKLDAFFGLDEEEAQETPAAAEESPGNGIAGGLLTALGTGLTALAAKGTVDQLQENKNLVQQLKQEATPSAEQTILLQLLESTLSLLPENGDGNSEIITKLTHTLYQQLEKTEIESLDLCTAISRTIAVLSAEIIELRKKVQ